jgi:hypothetical protein
MQRPVQTVAADGAVRRGDRDDADRFRARVDRRRRGARRSRTPVAHPDRLSGIHVSLDDVAVLEQVMGVDPPPQERLEFFG